MYGIPGQYRRFAEYLHLMHREALRIYGELSERPFVRMFFRYRYGDVSEQYWGAKKLYSLAMFLPTFLQIGLAYKRKGLFSNLVYLDTHAGPGLAKIGGEDHEVILGSPLIALRWPRILADRLRKFQRIREGFDRYILVDKDPEVARALRGVLDLAGAGGEVEVRVTDCNHYLDAAARNPEMLGGGYRPLVFLFVDPFGDLESQVQYGPLNSFLGALRSVDVVLNVMTGMLVRGLSELKNHPGKYAWWVRKLFGDLCEDEALAERNAVCRAAQDERAAIREESIVELYRAMLLRQGYTFVDQVPVEYRGRRALYYLVFASRSPGAQQWLGNYMNWLREKAPKTHEELKAIWLAVSKKGLDRYF